MADTMYEGSPEEEASETPEQEAQEEKDEYKGETIELPEDYRPPEDTEPGEEYDELVRVKISEDGKSLYVCAVGGVPTPTKQQEVDAKDRAEADTTNADNADSEADRDDSYGAQIYRKVRAST